MGKPFFQHKSLCFWRWVSWCVHCDVPWRERCDVTWCICGKLQWTAIIFRRPSETKFAFVYLARRVKETMGLNFKRLRKTYNEGHAQLVCFHACERGWGFNFICFSLPTTDPPTPAAALATLECSLTLSIQLLRGLGVLGIVQNQPCPFKQFIGLL